MNLIAFVKKPYDKKYRQYLGYYLKLIFYRFRYLIACTVYYIKQIYRYLKSKIVFQLLHIPDFETVIDILVSKIEGPKNKSPIQIKTFNRQSQTVVDNYWSEHTVLIRAFRSAFMSKRNLAWRFVWYPKFKELMELYGDHKKEVILDYGCGPGNDVVGFALYSRAKKIIGIDISNTALVHAQKRIAIHSDIDPKRIKLIKIVDATHEIPLKNNSVDYIYSEGVIHHVSNPLQILKELYRVLKPGGHACVMVYNYKSIFLHLFMAYEELIIKQKFPGLDIHQAFTKSTDGVNCPISRCYKDEEFIALGKRAGFKCEFLGGYLSLAEIDCIKRNYKQAVRDGRLSKEHRDFLKNLTWDGNLPMYEGKYAGIGGVYKFYKK